MGKCGKVLTSCKKCGEVWWGCVASEAMVAGVARCGKCGGVCGKWRGVGSVVGCGNVWRWWEVWRSVVRCDEL